MGFNSIAFILNDNMHQLKKCPNALAHSLSIPNVGSEDDQSWRDNFRHSCDEYKEIWPGRQSISMLPTFHANDVVVVAFGNNTYTKLLHTSGYHHGSEEQVRLLEQMADQLGYSIRKKPQKRAK